MPRKQRQIKTRIEPHRVKIRSHPVEEIDHVREVAIKLFRLEKITEAEEAFHDALALRLDSCADVFVPVVNGTARFRRTQKDAHFFKDLAHDGNPMAKRRLSGVAVAEKHPRVIGGKAAAALEYFRGIVAFEHRPAGKDIEATHEAHLRRPPRQQDIEFAVGIRPKEDNR